MSVKWIWRGVAFLFIVVVIEVHTGSVEKKILVFVDVGVLGQRFCGIIRILLLLYVMSVKWI